MLNESGTISESDLLRAKNKASQENVSLSDAVVALGLLSEEEIVRLTADTLGFPCADLSATKLLPEMFAILPEIVARKNLIVAFKKDAEGLHLAMADPTDLEIRNFIERKQGLKVKAYIASMRDIENILDQYGGQLSETLKKTIEIFENSKQDKDKVEPPIVGIVKDIVSYAYRNRASDIHVEPRNEEDSVIRFRIDGVLHDVATLPAKLHDQVVSRIKVLSHLRTDEHQTPQDGKISFPLEKEDVDIRISIVPVTDGEKIVMRLLSERSRSFSLASLGLSEIDVEKIKSAYEKPFGMVLATGPTGCGKTTTLYAIMKLLNKRDVNIMTIEDPVEYDIEGVSQIQVNTKAKLTFATGLRSILRQDPNIILIGEIRDKETANISINLSMTGHLVLSSLHTNDAATSVPRLIDLGIEPFLIASTVSCIVGQRLVRKIHTACQVSEEVDAKEILDKVGDKAAENIFGITSENLEGKKIRLYRGRGCEACNGSGYESRIGIFEVLEMNDEIRKAILAGREAQAIAEIAQESGMKTMFFDGLEKAKAGLTTLEEVLAATKI